MRTRFASALASVLLFASQASADPAPDAAEELFVRARSLMKTGDCVKALPLLEQSHAIEASVGSRFNMALCETKMGKLIQAAEHLRSVVAESVPDDDRRTHAERALRELLPRIPHLVLELDTTRHDLEAARLDGEFLAALRVNEPFAINPGPHELEVVLTREKPQNRRFSVSEGQTYTWSLGGETSEPPPGSDRASTPGESSKRDATTELAKPSGTIWTKQRTAAAVAAGTSVVSFGVATGLAINARALHDSAARFCRADDACRDAGIRRRDSARVQGNIATVALTVGIASALAAGTLWLTGAPSSPNPSSTVRFGMRFDGTRAPRAQAVIEGTY
jgi:hypothetical protein